MMYLTKVKERPKFTLFPEELFKVEQREGWVINRNCAVIDCSGTVDLNGLSSLEIDPLILEKIVSKEKYYILGEPVYEGTFSLKFYVLFGQVPICVQTKYYDYFVQKYQECLGYEIVFKGARRLDPVIVRGSNEKGSFTLGYIAPIAMEYVEQYFPKEGD